MAEQSARPNAWSLDVHQGGVAPCDILRHNAEKHRPRTAARIVAYDVADHPTENQLIALGRKFFEL